MGDMQLGWGGGVGKGGDVCSVNWGDGKTSIQKIDRKSCNDEIRELISVFHNPHRKCRPSPSVVACTLEYLVGVPP